MASPDSIIGFGLDVVVLPTNRLFSDRCRYNGISFNLHKPSNLIDAGQEWPAEQGVSLTIKPDLKNRHL
jgi:hypothetical protein